jgi:DNA-binding CsgD family transcriptional regulator
VNITKEQLEPLWLSGIPVKEITTKLGCSRRTVQNYVHKFGLPLRKNVKLTPEQLSMLEDLYVNTILSIREITKMVGSSEFIVYEQLHKSNWVRVRETELQRIVTEQFNNGVTDDEIANLLKITHHRVKQIRKQLNLKKKNRRLTESEKQQIKELIERGSSREFISTKLKIHKSLVVSHLRKLGFVRANSVNHMDLTDSEFKKLITEVVDLRLNTQLSFGQIARKFNLYSGSSLRALFYKYRTLDENEYVRKNKLSDTLLYEIHKDHAVLSDKVLMKKYKRTHVYAYKKYSKTYLNKLEKEFS